MTLGSPGIASAAVLAAWLWTLSPAKAETPAGYVSARQFGAKCDGVTDDASALQEAINKASRVHFPKGTCLLNTTVRLRAGTELRGEGIGISIIKQGRESVPAMGILYADSGSAGARVEGITISGMTIYGQSDVSGFSEFQHLISINGVKRVLIERVEFRGFRGDGLYIGSGIAAGHERHNEDIVVRDSIFDGLDHSNRNGISVIDGDGILIEGNLFRNTTQPKMPGAIDIEPNGHSFHVVKNITIRDNFFSKIGGNLSAIAVFLNSKLAATPTGFRIERNNISGRSGGILFYTGVEATLESMPNNLTIAENVVTTLGRSLVVRGARQFRVVGNVFAGAAASSWIGYTNKSDRCVDGAISDNEFRDIENVGLVVFSADRLEISRNRFVDIGNGKAGSYAISFSTGTSSHVRLVGNIIASPKAKTTFAIQKERRHTFNPTTNFQEGNQLINLSGNAFQATRAQ